MDDVPSQKVLDALKELGPSLPLQIKKQIGMGDTIVIGAKLSTLTAKKEVKYTKLKRGGSPFYYLPGQEEKLQDFYENLNEKDQKTFLLLKDKKVIQESKVDPLTRVSLSNIPDFSKKLLINHKGEKIIFWKYYLTSDEKALELIRAILKPNISNGITQVKSLSTNNTSEQKFLEESKEVQEKSFASIKKETQQIIQNTNYEKDGSEFETKLLDFLKQKNILLKNIVSIRKNSEYDLNVELTLEIGKIEFYVKAKNKKKSNEGDLSVAYLESLKRRIPCIYLTSGEVTNKLRETISKDFKGLILIEKI